MSIFFCYANIKKNSMARCTDFVVGTYWLVKVEYPQFLSFNPLLSGNPKEGT